jgi:hypothetical protein
VSVTVDDELEARIAKAVAARREVIAELVREAVDATAGFRCSIFEGRRGPGSPISSARKTSP